MPAKAIAGDGNTTTPPPAITLKDVVEKSLSFATLKAFGTELLGQVAREFVTHTSELNEQRKDLTEKLKAPLKAAGKLLAAAKEAYAETGTGSFVSWFEEETGKPFEKMGRALQCCRVFQRLVIPGLLPESDYDNVVTDWLETTSKIVDLVSKSEDLATSVTMKQVVDILKVRPEKGAKMLREIRNRLEGKDTVSEDGKGVVLDLPNLKAILERGLSSVDGAIGVVLTCLIGQVKLAGQMPHDVAKNFYFGTVALGDAWGDDPAAAKLADQFDDERTAAKREVKLIPAEAEATPPAPVAAVIALPDFVAWATENYEGLDASDHELIAVEARRFFEANGRLPHDSVELDNVLNGEGQPAAAAVA